ncbi:hypothetical protein [Chelatococcus asaccharovorans]|jgi:hypothetical protein|uniref:hypothetical protein n=1 Tax=Chelatococcus asaccharovorans TaxID=28210 RepID=UPI00224C73C0|nr:hypothetical protein [Chelatococcus asaccharovorans]CAH1659864.1 conserved exported hypothetical protein [Chelatococcus asaccharovorans]CAH1684031.1 conserved exported hypothetical protein [Chelatococcus asaccharovorans]
MRRAVIILSGLAALCATLPAIGQNTRFGVEPPRTAGQIQPDPVVGLSDVMILKQWRHIKLWYAAKSDNWDLVNYELQGIASSLNRAAVHYVNIPVDYVVAATKTISDMREAAAARDHVRFNRGYGELTTACNSCHAAGGVGFIRIQTPTASPFSDQSY